MEFKLTSPSFGHGTGIPSKYTCDGDNINPHLVIQGVPEGTKSLALIVDDPDAPGQTWVHWLVWDIPPETSEIREHTVPFKGIEGTTSWGKPGYGGPCPPSGSHRYFFRLFALSKKLGLAEGALREELDEAMQGKVLAATELMGTYERTRTGPM